MTWWQILLVIGVIVNVIAITRLIIGCIIFINKDHKTHVDTGKFKN